MQKVPNTTELIKHERNRITKWFIVSTVIVFILSGLFWWNQAGSYYKTLYEKKIEDCIGGHLK